MKSHLARAFLCNVNCFPHSSSCCGVGQPKRAGHQCCCPLQWTGTDSSAKCPHAGRPFSVQHEYMSTPNPLDQLSVHLALRHRHAACPGENKHMHAACMKPRSQSLASRLAWCLRLPAAAFMGFHQFKHAPVEAGWKGDMQ